MKKKITTLLLMSALALSVVACGDQEGSESKETPEPTEEPTNQSVPEGLEGLPKDRVWIDDLYEKLIAYDVEGVLEILHDPDFENKIEPYLYPEFALWDSDAGYKLYTTDYKLVGVIMQHIQEDEPDKFAFYSEEEDHGFEDIGHGEILIGYEHIQGQDKLLCCDGMTAIYEAAGETYDVSEPGSIFIPWYQ